jgi:hypothetical protein
MAHGERVVPGRLDLPQSPACLLEIHGTVAACAGIARHTTSMHSLADV